MISWRDFTAAPHRMMFFGGAVQLVLAVLFWAAELIGRYTGLWSPFETTVATSFAHIFLMLYGLFTFFIFGFLMTTYPRWMGGELIPLERYRRTFLLLMAGVILFYLGLFFAKPLLIGGVLLLLAGWVSALHALLHVYLHAPTPNKHYESLLNVALSCGWFGALSYLLWLLGGPPLLLKLSMVLGLWLYLVAILVTVSHRMIPYFSSCVLSDYQPFTPPWSLFLFWPLLALHALLELADAWSWLPLADLPLALLALYHSYRWSFRRSFGERLLAVLHIAFLWFGIGMVLYSIQGLILLFTDTLPFGRAAPLHALAIGFVTSMMVAFASRVTLGHSGRALVADRFTWGCFLGVSLVALLRIVAEFPGMGATASGHLNICAALVWLIVLGAWVGRFAPYYLTPRADGNPG